MKRLTRTTKATVKTNQADVIILIFFDIARFVLHFYNLYTSPGMYYSTSDINSKTFQRLLRDQFLLTVTILNMFPEVFATVLCFCGTISRHQELPCLVRSITRLCQRWAKTHSTTVNNK